jgi:hypothetical protein
VVRSNHEDEQTDPDCKVATTFGVGGHELAMEMLVQDEDSLLLNITDDSVLSPATDSYAIDNLSIDLDCWNATGNLLDEHTLATAVYLRPTQLDIRLLYQFPFLDNFTKATGFVTSFACGSREQRLFIASESSNSKSLGHLQPAKYRSQRSSTHWTEITRDALVLRNDCDIRDANIIRLLPKTHEIVSQIREATVMKHAHSPIDMTWSTPLEALCYKFFHPIALQKHLALFWSCWYPNWPTIHRPTFDVTEKSPALVAAMALVGACLSPDSGDYATSQIWFNVVEALVFSNSIFNNPDVSDAWEKSDQACLRKLHLDIIQAAYCVCLYQTWEGCKRSKRRILRQRFNDLVYVSRIHSISGDTC